MHFYNTRGLCQGDFEKVQDGGNYLDMTKEM
jgi:hypothetical protein